MKSYKIILILLILNIMVFIISGCGGGIITPPISDSTDTPDYEEVEFVEITSEKIDINVGGVVEVTDESSEIYRTRFVIDPIDKERTIKERSAYEEISIVISQMFWGKTNKMVDNQGFLITPIGIWSTISDLVTGRLEISYNKDKLSNSGVSKNSDVNVYRVACLMNPIKLYLLEPIPNMPWEKVPDEKITHLENMASIEIGFGDLGYLYTLTVTNCVPPSNLGTPLPGDLVYRLSAVGVNDNWLPGHVGIYVGEKYHEEDGLYNVIEAIGISPNKVVRSYYPDITKFGGGEYVYMGAREPKDQSLTHINRNTIVNYVEKMVNMPYALFETTAGVYFGLARGNLVKGTDLLGSFNCVGLAEKAYEVAGVNNFQGLVSDYDEGNESKPPGPDALLTPQEQYFRTKPASTIIDQNEAPEISNLSIIPEGPIGTNSLVYITCNASDADNDELTYIWTIPQYEKNVTFTKGKSISWNTPSQEKTYEISCKVIDNYGGEDSYSIKISVGDSIVNQTPVIASNPVTSAIKGQLYSYGVNATDPDGDTLTYSLTTKPSGMTINSSTGLISWTPTSNGIFNVTVKVSDGKLSDTQSFTITVEEQSLALNPVQLLSPSNGASVNTSTVQLSWNPVPNATGYEVVYDTSSSFSNPIRRTVTTTYQTTNTLKDNTTYYWRVRAVVGGQYSPWSSVWSFTKGTPYSPVPPTNFTVTSYWNTTAPGFPSMTLSWSAVTGATGYEMWVRPAGGTSTNLGTRDAPYVTFNSNSLPGGVRYTPGQTYYFKVRTKTSNGTSSFTNEVSCVAATGPSSQKPNPPTNLSPGTTSAPGPTLSTLTPTLSWSKVSNADYYKVYISVPPYGNSNIIFENESVSGTSITISSGKLQRGQQYRWNVRAHNSAGDSSISDTLYFNTTSNTLNPVQLLSPSNGATINTSTVLLSWNPVANATGYEVVYDTSSSFASPVGWTVTTTYKSTSTLKDNTTYYWRVRAVAGSQKSPWSSVWSFTKSSTVTRPNPPTNLSPGSISAPGPTLTTLTPKLSWSKVSNATYYRVYVSVEPYGTGNLVFWDEQYYGGNSITIPSGKLQWGKKYRWNIQACNSAGYSEHSDTLYFNTQVTVQTPSPPTGLSPGHILEAFASTIYTLTPKLSWSKVSNATYYRVYVSVEPYGTGNLVFWDEQYYGGNSITIPSGKLQWGKKYRWNIQACNSAGYSEHSDTLYFKTL